jgi:hypothetical protein
METSHAAGRHCFFVDESTRGPSGYVAALVTDGEPGYRLLAGGPARDERGWGTDLADARRWADHENERLGLSDIEVEQMVGCALARAMSEQIRRASAEAAQHRLSEALGGAGGARIRVA